MRIDDKKLASRSKIAGDMARDGSRGKRSAGTPLPFPFLSMKPRRSRISAYGLIHDAGRILLCRLSPEVPRWEGYWTLPGGGIDFGESPEQTVVREVEEETGLVVRVKSLCTIDTIHDPSGAEDFHGIRIIYQVDVIGGSLRHETSGSTDRCEWHDLHAMPEVPMVDLAETGVRIARELWPS